MPHRVPWLGGVNLALTARYINIMLNDLKAYCIVSPYIKKYTNKCITHPEGPLVIDLTLSHSCWLNDSLIVWSTFPESCVSRVLNNSFDCIRKSIIPYNACLETHWTNATPRPDVNSLSWEPRVSFAATCLLNTYRHSQIKIQSWSILLMSNYHT